MKSIFTARSCGSTPYVQNGELTKIEHLLGGDETDILYYIDQAHYRCEDDYHYKLHQEFYIDCLAGGQFNDPNPSCSGK